MLSIHLIASFFVFSSQKSSAKISETSTTIFSFFSISNFAVLERFERILDIS